MHPPLIAVSTSVTVDKYPERAYVNAAYLNAIQQAGGVPLPLPPQLEPSARAELLKHVHGVLLTGGGDVDPARFGEPPHPATAEVSPARDSLEIDLTRWALEIDVNSFHHQAIKRIGRGLEDVAWAPDSIVEGVELSDPGQFVVGVQWHPEELVDQDRAALNLFAALVNHAQKRARL